MLGAIMKDYSNLVKPEFSQKLAQELTQWPIIEVPKTELFHGCWIGSGPLDSFPQGMISFYR